MDPLHIYLKGFIYDWYSEGKDHELRIPRGMFKPANLPPGRPLILYCGNSQVSRTGTVGPGILGSLDEILFNVPPERFAPGITSKEEFVRQAVQLLGRQDEYFAFQVVLDR